MRAALTIRASSANVGLGGGKPHTMGVFADFQPFHTIKNGPKTGKPHPTAISIKRPLNLIGLKYMCVLLV